MNFQSVLRHAISAYVLGIGFQPFEQRLGRTFATLARYPHAWASSMTSNSQNCRQDRRMSNCFVRRLERSWTLVKSRRRATTSFSLAIERLHTCTTTQMFSRSCPKINVLPTGRMRLTAFLILVASVLGNWRTLHPLVCQLSRAFDS